MKVDPKYVKRAAISTANFYGKAKRAYKVGKSIVRSYDNGIKIAKAVKSKYRKFTRKSRPSHYTGSVGSHNDWSQLPKRTFIVGSKKAPKVEGTYQLVHGNDFIAESAGTGVQHVGLGIYCLNNNHLSGSTQSGRNFFLNYWATDPFLLNPYSVPPTANAIYTTASTVPIDSDKIIVKSVESKVNVINLSPTALKIRIYWLLCNKNSDDAPTTAWTEVLSEQKYLQPSAAVGPTGTATATNTVGYESSSLHGAELPPHYSKRWKTIHKDVFMLQPGDNESMIRTFVYNKTITKQQLSEFTQVNIKGWTLVPLVVIEGALVGLAADGEVFGSTNVDRVTYARSKIGYLQTDKITFGAVGTNRYTIRRNEIGYVTGNTANVTQIVDADDSTIDATPMN